VAERFEDLGSWLLSSCNSDSVYAVPGCDCLRDIGVGEIFVEANLTEPSSECGCILAKGSTIIDAAGCKSLSAGQAIDIQSIAFT
jgi:hypothetical protein